MNVAKMLLELGYKGKPKYEGFPCPAYLRYTGDQYQAEVTDKSAPDAGVHNISKFGGIQK